MATGLRLASGQALCVEPDEAAYHYQVFTDHQTIDRCGEVRIADHGAYVVVLFVQANRVLSIQPDGRLETRAANAVGPWEQLHRNGTSLWQNGIPGTPLMIDGVIAPPVPDLQPLRISGRDFVTESGARRVLKGCDAFMAYRLFLDGGAAALVPFVEESRSLAFDLWRVFLMGSKRQNQVMDLAPSEAGYYDRLRPFVATLNANGLTLLATVFVDAQDVMPNVSARQAHWREMASQLRGTVTLLSAGNEWRKNGFDPGEMSDPGMIWSRGSDLSVGDNEHAPYRPYGSFAEYHPRRDLWASLMDTVASPVFIYETNGLQAPLIIDEPPKMGTNGSGGFEQPAMARRYAQHLSAECAGAVFHNYFNQRGLLMDGHTRMVAEAWQAGMTP